MRVKIYCGGVRAKLMRERIASERHERNRFNGVFLGYVEKCTISADGTFCDRYAAISSAIYPLPMKKAGLRPAVLFHGEAGLIAATRPSG